MPATLTAYPPGPFVQHGSGQTNTVQTYVYPGAVQPTQSTYPTSYPFAAFLQHGSGQTNTVQSYVSGGAVQPIRTAALTSAPAPRQVFTLPGGFMTPEYLISPTSVAGALVAAGERWLARRKWLLNGRKKP